MNCNFVNLDDDAQERIRFVLSFFPELNDVPITFKLMKIDNGYSGYCNWSNRTIRLRKDILGYNHVIAHELTHMVSHHIKGNNGNSNIPKGEKACDIWTLARSPLLNDVAPYYLYVPYMWRITWDNRMARSFSNLALETIALREQGKKHYIKWFEESVRICNFLGDNDNITLLCDNVTQ